MPENISTQSIARAQHSPAEESARTLTNSALLKEIALIEISKLAEQGDRHAKDILCELARQSIVHCAVYPGSFDPFTKGHRDIVERGLQLFDQIIVAVGVNPQKKTGLLSKEERIAVIREDLKDLGDRVRVVEYSDASIDAAQREGANFIIRGVRGPTDYPSETDLAQINREQTKNKIETIMIVSDPEKAKVSSSVAKELTRLDLDTSNYLSQSTSRLLERKIFEPLLQEHWNLACNELGISDCVAAKTKFSEIMTTLNGPNRHYHNIVHVWRMIDMFVNSGIEVENRAAFLIAIFFHDLVYQPGSHQNEVQSAEACGSWLKDMGVNQEIINATKELILATAHHNVSAVGKDVALLLDLDLAILSATEDRYRRYAEGIRREFESVPERKYCLKRSQILRNFAARESIYSNSNSLPVSNERARANLIREADILDLKAPRREGPWYSHVSVVTGTIGSGKSSVLQILKEGGAFVVSADDLVLELKQPGEVCHQAIVEEFGDGVLDSTGAIDNKKLAEFVFADEHARSRLEEIIQPAVWNLAQERFEKAELVGEEILIFEVPLYFEANWDKKGFKHALVVSTPDTIAIERIMRRNQLTQAQAEARLASQLPAEDKILRADFNIRNDESVEQLRTKVEKILPLLKS